MDPKHLPSIVVCSTFLVCVAALTIFSAEVNINRHAQKVRQKEKEKEHEILKR